jgi:glucose/arabinose dehydrogenase
VYVVEQPGLVRVVTDRLVRPRPFLDLRRRVSRGELRGLFSLAFHPNYRYNHRLFIAYSGRDGNLYVDEFRARNRIADPHTRRTVLQVTIPVKSGDAHFGGQLAFGPDGDLYVSVGDGSRGDEAQDLGSRLGKILRVDIDRATPTNTIYAYGLRNPWRFSFAAKGDMLIGDVGGLHREEIDYLPRAHRGPLNFGWNVYEGTLLLEPADPAQTYTPPLVEYPHRGSRCYAVIGGYVYRGHSAVQLRGRYLYGDLCGGIWSLDPRGGRAAGRRVEQIARPARRSAVLTSFGEDAHGELYLLYQDGEIDRIAS